MNLISRGGNIDTPGGPERQQSDGGEGCRRCGTEASFVTVRIRRRRRKTSAPVPYGAGGRQTHRCQLDDVTATLSRRSSVPGNAALAAAGDMSTIGSLSRPVQWQSIGAAPTGAGIHCSFDHLPLAIASCRRRYSFAHVQDILYGATPSIVNGL